MGCQGRRLESCVVIENLGGSPFEIMTEIISGGYEVPGPGAGGAVGTRARTVNRPATDGSGKRCGQWMHSKYVI